MLACRNVYLVSNKDAFSTLYKHLNLGSRKDRSTICMVLDFSSIVTVTVLKEGDRVN